MTSNLPSDEELLAIRTELSSIGKAHDDDWRLDNYSEEDWDRLKDLIRQCILGTPPRCIEKFRVTPTPNRFERPEWDLVTSWSLECECEGSHGQVMGYSLADYNERYEGPLHFVRPLSLACSNCASATQIVDNHGYHEEIAKEDGGIGSANVRGEGAPEPFRCHHCHATKFAVETTFSYSPGAFDQLLEFPDTRSQDYFDILEVRGTCAECGGVSLVMQYES